MPYGYTPTNWISGTTPSSQPIMNNIETQFVAALLAINEDVVGTAFVLDGYVASKDGTTANQLDVTTGVAYLIGADAHNDLVRVALAASTTGEFTTSAATTVYYLDLNPDGTWSFATSHSSEANYLPIAQVLTDGSGNISTVTDERATTIKLFPNAIGTFQFGSGSTTFQTQQSGSANGMAFQAWTGSAAVTPFSVSGASGGPVGGSLDYIDEYGSFGFTTSSSGKIVSGQTGGSATGITFVTWSGSASKTPFSVGGQFNSALAYVDASGDLYAVGGTFSAVAEVQSLTISGRAGFGGTTPAITNSGGLLELWSEQSGGSALGAVFPTWSGSATVIPFSVGGRFESALAWVDGSGNLALSSGSKLFLDGATATAYIEWSAASNEIFLSTEQSGSANGYILQTWSGTALVVPFSVGAPGYSTALCRVDNSGYLHTPAVQSTASYLGFKDSAGNKIAEMKNGEFVIAGSGTYYTAGGTYNYSAGGSFDSFDVSEAYETDDEHPAGTVLCPGARGALTRCTHDGCRAAMLVSQGGAMAIGMGRTEEDAPLDPRIKPMALVGRIKARCAGDIPAFAADGQATLLTSDGAGGVRAMRAGEAGYSLGYALHDAHDGQIGMVVRSLWCVMPAETV